MTPKITEHAKNLQTLVELKKTTQLLQKTTEKRLRSAE